MRYGLIFENRYFTCVNNVLNSEAGNNFSIESFLVSYSKTETVDYCISYRNLYFIGKNRCENVAIPQSRTPIFSAC